MPGVTVVVEVAVEVSPGVVLAVAVGITAPSSRKSLDGLPHQWSCASVSSDGVAVFVEEPELPPNGVVHAARNIIDSTRKAARMKLTNLPGECFK